MKHSFIALCTALALTTAASAQTAPKLGHIDRQELMLKHPARPAAEAKMKAFAEKLDNSLKAMGAEYQAKVADVQARFEAMTQTEKEAAQREVAEMEQRIQTAQENAKEDLAKQEQELLAPMMKDAEDAIKAVGNENGFTYIFDTSIGAVLFYDKGEDVMPLVKKKMNIP
jgi:outer membrane protein